MNPAPTPPPTRRFRGLVLLALFLAGSAGVPLADAAVFHRGGGDDLARVVHVEAAGASHHADDCLLGVATPASSGASVAVAAVHAELPSTALFPLHPIEFHAGGVDPGATRPRAPPIA